MQQSSIFCYDREEWRGMPYDDDRRMDVYH